MKKFNTFKIGDKVKVKHNNDIGTIATKAGNFYGIKFSNSLVIPEYGLHHASDLQKCNSETIKEKLGVK